MTETDTTDVQLRERAVQRLKKRRDFAAHLLVYTLVNTVLVLTWMVTSSGFFWPMFPIAFWGIGLVMNAWDVWRGDTCTAAQIEHEMVRLRDESPLRPSVGRRT